MEAAGCEDRISALPDEVIHHLLGLLPAPEVVAPISGAVAPSLSARSPLPLSPRRLPLPSLPCLTPLSPSEGDADWAEASVGVTEEVVAYAWDATSPSSPAMPTLVVRAFLHWLPTRQ